MAERYLIDTSVVIKYLNAGFSISALRALDGIIDNESQISFITEIELQVWKPVNPADLDVYLEFIANSSVMGIDKAVIHNTIRIRKEYGLKLPDAIIAATAIANKLILLADNDKDFGKVPDLTYVNPAKLQ